MGKWTLALFALAMAAVLSASSALANGTERLGRPSVHIAGGTGIVAAGTGLQAFPNIASSFSVSVPAGASVKQVLLYWEGHWTKHGSYALHTPQAGGDSTLSVNGIPVAGTKIGGSTKFYEQDAGAVHGKEMFVTYRADISSLNLVSAGSNTLTIDDLQFESNFLTGFPFTQGNDGAGVVVVYDDGTSSGATIGVRDGLDLAYYRFAPPLDTTVPQTFTFSASTSPRTAALSTLAGSVGSSRPDQLVITFAPAGAPIVLDNPWQGLAGPSWDALNSVVVIPAGATSMTVQALSAGSGGEPASIAWDAAALSVPAPPPPAASHALTLAYWKHHKAPVSATCGPSNGCRRTGPWTSQFLSQTLGGYSVDTTQEAIAVWAAKNCGSSKAPQVIGCLAAHLLAAKLNVANAASTCIAGTLAGADAFLTGVTYAGPSGTYPLTSGQRDLAIQLKNTLKAYNNGSCPS
jgi:hypothetical protein